MSDPEISDLIKSPVVNSPNVLKENLIHEKPKKPFKKLKKLIKANLKLRNRLKLFNKKLKKLNL